MIAAPLLRAAWLGASLPHALALRCALKNPERAQQRVLESYLRANADTAFGRAHGFSAIRTPADFQRAVPLAVYDDFVPWIDRIRAGEPHVLSRAKVERLVPSSGSTAAAKLIPYTSVLQAEFGRGVCAWVAELYRRRPWLLGGLAYWSITPVTPLRVEVASQVPVGFQSDSAYLGGFLGRSLAATLAVNPVVAGIANIEAFRYVTALELLRARVLALVSVWHPSFLTLLFEALTRDWDALVRDLRSGQPSVELDPTVRAALTTRGDPKRADELRSLEPGAWTEIWPRLALVSCWGDAQAAGAFEELAESLPGVELQAKGLLATEAFATLPFDGGWPVSVRSHFFEFVDAAKRPRLLHELALGEEYSLVVTTGGGLYRYCLQDRVRVVGFVANTPSLRFVGKEDRVSDRFGEKLDDGFVARILSEKLSGLARVHFAMLAPDERAAETGYTLYIETPDTAVSALAPELERELAQNPHYRYCRELGQLGPLHIFIVQRGAHATYIERFRAGGQRLGDIKPAALSADSGWSKRFDGSYAKNDGTPPDRVRSFEACRHG